MMNWEARKAKHDEYVAIAREVAEILGGTLEMRDEVDLLSANMHLNLPNIHEHARLILRFEDYQHPGKVRVMPLYERETLDGQVARPEQVMNTCDSRFVHAIGITRSRGAKAIAREIERRILRFLPAVLDMLETYIAQENEKLANAEKTRQRLAEALGTTVSDRTQEIYIYKDGCSITARANYDGTDVSLTLNSLPASLAHEILELCANYFREQGK